MTKITYEQFVEIISKYRNFNNNILLALYEEFGKKKINNLFEKHLILLNGTEFIEALDKYSVYFDQKKIIESFIYDDEDQNIKNVVQNQINDALRYPLMTVEEEKIYGKIITLGREKLKIIKKSIEVSNDEEECLYPKLDIEKILLSISEKKHLELLKKIQKLPYTLNDEMILVNDMKIIKDYLKISEDKIPDISELKNNFSSLNFSNIIPLGEYELNEQLNLLEKYIFAIFNFYNRNLKLVISIAKKKYKRNIDLEEWIQEGNIGLIKAINRFDSEKDVRFPTYATYWIKQTIFRAMSNFVNTIRFPDHIIKKLKQYEKFAEQYALVYGRKPTLLEISQKLGYSEYDITQIKKLTLEIISLETQIGEEEYDTLYSLIASDDSLIEDEIITRTLTKEILTIMNEKIKPRDMKIFFDRIGYNSQNRVFTLEEIGKEHGMTKEAIRKIENKVKTKIRNYAKIKEIM